MISYPGRSLAPLDAGLPQLQRLRGHQQEEKAAEQVGGHYGRLRPHPPEEEEKSLVKHVRLGLDGRNYH